MLKYAIAADVKLNLNVAAWCFTPFCTISALCNATFYQSSVIKASCNFLSAQEYVLGSGYCSPCVSQMNYKFLPLSR